jgi:hypothetical protein
VSTITESKKLIFHTNGPIDPICWEVMGVSAKLTDNPIGQFGTGLKYAIAVFLRLGHQFTIHSEGKVFNFYTETFIFRDKSFERIKCNDTTLPFTTEYGKLWEPWMAYRELVSNTMDEGGIHFLGEPMEEGTSIVIEGNQVAECYRRHKEFFLEDETPIQQFENVEVYAGNGTIFYKGVKVGSVEHSRHNYNIKKGLTLTEDRTFKYEFELKHEISCGMLRQCKDEQFIYDMMSTESGFEGELSYDFTWGPTAEAAGKRLWKESPHRMNKRCREEFKKRFRDASFEYVEPDELQTKYIDQAKSFLSKAGYPVDSPIKIVANSDDNLGGYYYKGVIYLVPNSFTRGLRRLIVILFEESRHAKGHEDGTRQYQTYLTEELVTQMALASKQVL